MFQQRNPQFLGSQTNTPLTRRRFLGSATALSGATIALLAGAPSLGARDRADSAEADVKILNGAIAAEREAVAAYGVGAESGLLSDAALKLAVQFQGHHREHAGVLESTVKTLGGNPVEAPPSYAFPVDTLQSEADVLRFAADLEQGAISAYMSAVHGLGTGDLARAAASILGDEAMHWAVLRYVLGENPVPVAFVA